MTREELNEIPLGSRILIKDEFFDEPHPDLVNFLGTIQVLERIEYMSDITWAYFKGVPQPFTATELVEVVTDMPLIDEDQYDLGDLNILIGGVSDV